MDDKRDPVMGGGRWEEGSRRAVRPGRLALLAWGRGRNAVFALACKTLGQAAADLAILEAAALMPNRESRCDLQRMGPESLGSRMPRGAEKGRGCEGWAPFFPQPGRDVSPLLPRGCLPRLDLHKDGRTGSNGTAGAQA